MGRMALVDAPVRPDAMREAPQAVRPSSPLKKGPGGAMTGRSSPRASVCLEKSVDSTNATSSSAQPSRSRSRIAAPCCATHASRSAALFSSLGPSKPPSRQSQRTWSGTGPLLTGASAAWHASDTRGNRPIPMRATWAVPAAPLTSDAGGRRSQVPDGRVVSRARALRLLSAYRLYMRLGRATRPETAPCTRSFVPPRPHLRLRFAESLARAASVFRQVGHPAGRRRRGHGAWLAALA